MRRACRACCYCAALAAWCEIDVANLLARRYKGRSKFIFLTQLTVAFAMVVVGLLLDQCSERRGLGLLELPDDKYSSGGTACDHKLHLTLRHGLFGLSTVIFLISVLESILNASTRWHQLRSMACSLEAIVWPYRARVGRFQQSITDSARPRDRAADRYQCVAR